MSQARSAFNVQPGEMVDSWSRPQQLRPSQIARLDPWERAIHAASQQVSDDDRHEKLRREVLGFDELDYWERAEPPDDWAT